VDTPRVLSAPVLMVAFLVTIHVLVSIFLIFVILLQPGKGDGMGAAIGGGGGSSSVFGSRGSVTFLAKVTEVCAIIFMVTSLTLAYRSSHSDSVLRARRNLAADDAANAAKKKDDAGKAGGAIGATGGAQSTPAAPGAPKADQTAPAGTKAAPAPAATPSAPPASAPATPAAPPADKPK
jgi:preprotein translocase subunit SecG